MSNINSPRYNELLASALSRLKYSHSPYSNFKVAAALRTANNQIYSGCNVENASYGLTICAECCAICNMINQGEKKITEILVLSSEHNITTPCGACRQTISEFADNDCLIHLAHGDQYEQVKTLTLSELLPYSFKLETT